MLAVIISMSNLICVKLLTIHTIVYFIVAQAIRRYMTIIDVFSIVNVAPNTPEILG